MMSTPVGQLRISTCAEGVTGVFFEGPGGREASETTDADPRAAEVLRAVCTELAAYFDGRLRRFTVPCVLAGTPFQQQVWRALESVSFGEVVSYRTIAERIGNVKAVRAVGAANGQNPVPIIIPCHRVIGSDGSLTGFGGGLPRKQWLLQHEGAASSLLL